MADDQRNRLAPWLTALAVSAIVALAATPALAGGSQYPTLFTKFKYKLDGGVATFKGEIGSVKGGCVPDRKVKLYRQHSGETDKVGGDHTNNKGKFEIDLGNGPPRDGKYYAEIKQTKLSSDKTCLGRTSGSVKITSS
jgi:hypothetical protein